MLLLIISGIIFANDKNQKIADCINLWNPSTIRTIDGVVKTVLNNSNKQSCVEILLKTSQMEIVVHTAPAAYLTKNKFVLKPGDKIIAEGSVISLCPGTKCRDCPYFDDKNTDCLQACHKSTLLAKTLKKDKQCIALRDAKGNPVWVVSEK